MHFFISQLKEALSKPLPGAHAHAKMAPQGRGHSEEAIRDLLTPARISAVMVLLFPENEDWKMVLIKRPDYEGVHSGQISFPGGKFEEMDGNYVQTALRETREEIGIPEDQIEILGALSRVYIPPSNFIVYPFVGLCLHPPVFELDTKEVDSILFPPVHLLLDDTIRKEGIFMASTDHQWKVKAPYYHIEGHKVWGATAIILSELREIIARITTG